VVNRTDWPPAGAVVNIFRLALFNLSKPLQDPSLRSSAALLPLFILSSLPPATLKQKTILPHFCSRALALLSHSLSLPIYPGPLPPIPRPSPTRPTSRPFFPSIPLSVRCPFLSFSFSVPPARESLSSI
jgi:hypothetical protein